MIAYRPHRGSLKNALKETRVFANEYEMKQRIANEWNLTCGRKELNPENIVISQDEYSDYKSGWQRVHDVCVTKIGNRNFVDELGAVQCIGYCSYDISNAPKIGQWINVKTRCQTNTIRMLLDLSKTSLTLKLLDTSRILASGEIKVENRTMLHIGCRCLNRL